MGMAGKVSRRAASNVCEQQCGRDQQADSGRFGNKSDSNEIWGGVESVVLEVVEFIEIDLPTDVATNKTVRTEA